MKPGFTKVGMFWFVCNDAGLTDMGIANCGPYRFEESWDDGNLRKRCEYRNGRTIMVDIYCVNAGEQVSPGQLVMINEDSNSAMICSRERNGSLLWQVATDDEIQAWWGRYV